MKGEYTITTRKLENGKVGIPITWVELEKILRRLEIISIDEIINNITLSKPKEILIDLESKRGIRSVEKNQKSSQQQTV